MSKGELTLEPPPETSGTTVESKGLKGGALGLLSSVVVGMASTAPAYSLAATLGLIVASGGALLSGVKAPAIVLISFIPMYLIAVAYQELNKAEPDCGTTFTWASRTFGPIVGWMGGWGIIAADVIVMANLAQIAGAYSFTFVGDLGWHSAAELAGSTLWSTVAGVIWIMVMTYICYRGIEVSARMQYALLSIEIVVLVILSVVALVKVYTHNAEDYSLLPSLSWFWPGGLDFGTIIAPAVLTAIFIYWGWDTAVACNEESDDPGTTPGRAAVISTFLLLATYALVTVAAIAFAGTGTEGIGLGNAENSADVFAAIGPDLFGDSVLGQDRHAVAVRVDPDLGVGVDPDDDPADRADHAVDGCVQGAARRRSPRSTARYLTPTRVDDRDGRRVDHVLRAVHADQPEPADRVDRLGRLDDRVLLRTHRIRVHVVLPQDAHQVRCATS